MTNLSRYRDMSGAFQMCRSLVCERVGAAQAEPHGPRRLPVDNAPAEADPQAEPPHEGTRHVYESLRTVQTIRSLATCCIPDTKKTQGKRCVYKTRRRLTDCSCSDKSGR